MTTGPVQMKCFFSGETYGDNWQTEWKNRYLLVKDQPNNGSFSFVPKPAQKAFSSWEKGSVHPLGGRRPGPGWLAQLCLVVIWDAT